MILAGLQGPSLIFLRCKQVQLCDCVKRGANERWRIGWQQIICRPRCSVHGHDWAFGIKKGEKKELNGGSTLSICCWSVPDKAVISCWFSILSYPHSNKMKIGSLKLYWFIFLSWRWEEERYPEGIKWKFLEHKGPVFAPPYEPLPENVKFYYDGELICVSTC